MEINLLSRVKFHYLLNEFKNKLRYSMSKTEKKKYQISFIYPLLFSFFVFIIIAICILFILFQSNKYGFNLYAMMLEVEW